MWKYIKDCFKHGNGKIRAILLMILLGVIAGLFV